MISTTLASILLLAAPQAPGRSAPKPTINVDGIPSNPAPSAKKHGPRKHHPRNLDLVANAEMLPGDSLAIVSMAPIGPHRVELMKTGLDDLLRFLGPKWKTSRFLSWIDLAPVDLRGLTESGFSLAISKMDFDGATPSPSWILIAPTSRAEELRKSLVEMHKAREDAGCKLIVEAVGTDKAWTIRDRNGKSVSYMITADAVLLGDSFSSIKGAVDQLGDVDSSLAASRPYLRYARKCSEEGLPFLTVLIQPQPLLQRAISSLPNSGARKEARRFIQKLELNRVSEIGTSLFAKDGQIRDFTWLGYPHPRTGPLAALLNGDHRVQVDQLKAVAPDAISAALFSVDIGKVYGETMAVADPLHPSAKHLLESALATIALPTKLNVARDILPLLSSRGVLQEWLPEGDRRACSLSIELRDTNAMRRLLNMLARARELESTSVESIPALLLPGGVNPNSSTLLTVRGSTLILASTTRSLKNVVTLLESGTAGKNHRLAGLIPTGASVPFFAWGACANLGRHWLRTLSIQAGYRLIARELSHIVRARAGTLVWSIETNADGITSRSQSPIGNLYLMLGVTYAVKMMAYEDETETAIVHRRRSIIRDLIAAEDDYRRLNYKDADGDKVGEFGSIGDLVAKDLISRRWFSPESAKTPSAEGYRFEVFTPNSSDGRENDFLLLAWPMHGFSGDAYAATTLGTIYRNEIIGQTVNLKSCDPRDFFAQGRFGADVLPGWELIETSMMSISNPDTITVNRELTPQEKAALDALNAAEESGTATPKILAFLNSQSPLIVAQTAFLMGKLKYQKAVPLLCDKVRGHPNTEVKRQAMAALCKIRNPRSIETSIEALSSTDSGVRTLAAQNLGYVHASAAVSRLLDVLTMDPNPDAPDRIAALLALADIGQPRCLVPSASRVKSSGKKDDKALVYLFQTISRELPPESEAETLMAVLDDDSELLRRFAIQRLGVLELPVASPALRARLEKETALRPLIDVSLRAIANAQTTERIRGYVHNAAAKGSAIWSSIPARVAYGIGAGLILGVILLRRIRRRRQFTRDGDRVVAMIAPSADFGYEDDGEYDEGYEDDFVDAFEEGNEFAEDDAEYVGEDESDQEDYSDGEYAPVHEDDAEDYDAGYYGEEDKDCYYGDDPLDEFYVDDEIIATD